LNADLVLPDGRRRVVRHEHDPVRTIQTGIGLVEVQKPKARDRTAPAVGERIRFASAILPVLTALLGKDAPNLSPPVIARLKGATSKRGSPE
jgi:hypothetical protein